MGISRKELGMMPKNWCLQTMVLEKTPESPVDSKIKPVNLKGNQPWTLVGSTDAEVETPVFWSSDADSKLIGKVPDAVWVGIARLKSRCQRLCLPFWRLMVWTCFLVFSASIDCSSPLAQWCPFCILKTSSIASLWLFFPCHVSLWFCSSAFLFHFEEGAWWLRCSPPIIQEEVYIIKSAVN